MNTLRTLCAFALACALMHAQTTVITVASVPAGGALDLAAGKMKPPKTTWAALPSAASSADLKYLVTDANATCDGGGGTTTPCEVWSNGSAWLKVSSGGTTGGTSYVAGPSESILIDTTPSPDEIDINPGQALAYLATNSGASASRQGNGSKFQMAGTISGSAGTALCLDANGNTTTSGCSAGSTAHTLNVDVPGIASVTNSGFWSMPAAIYRGDANLYSASADGFTAVWMGLPNDGTYNRMWFVKQTVPANATALTVKLVGPHSPSTNVPGDTVSLEAQAFCIAAGTVLSSGGIASPTYIGSPVSVSVTPNAVAYTLGADVSFANVNFTGCTAGSTLVVRLQRLSTDTFSGAFSWLNGAVFSWTRSGL